MEAATQLVRLSHYLTTPLAAQGPLMRRNESAASKRLSRQQRATCCVSKQRYVGVPPRRMLAAMYVVPLRVLHRAAVPQTGQLPSGHQPADSNTTTSNTADSQPSDHGLTTLAAIAGPRAVRHAALCVCAALRCRLLHSALQVGLGCWLAVLSVARLAPHALQIRAHQLTALTEMIQRETALTTTHSQPAEGQSGSRREAGGVAPVMRCWWSGGCTDLLWRCGR